MGNVRVHPDSLMIRYKVSSFDTDPSKAMKAFEDKWKKTQAIIKARNRFGYTTERFEELHVQVSTRKDSEKGLLRGTEISRKEGVRFQIKNASKLKYTALELAKAGATIESAEFQSHILGFYETKARLVAVEDAKQKAKEMCKAMGQVCGKALVIREGPRHKIAASEIDFSSGIIKSSGQKLDTRVTVNTKIEVFVTFELL